MNSNSIGSRGTIRPASGPALYAMADANRNEGGSRNVFRIPLAGGDAELILTMPASAEPWTVSVSPDGAWLVAALDESTSDA